MAVPTRTHWTPALPMPQHMTPAATNSARATALALPELLELIIQHLSLTNILTNTTRVSRRWHDVTVNSQAIQERLSHITKHSLTSLRNPDYYFWASKDAPSYMTPLVMNPMLLPAAGVYSRRSKLPWTYRIYPNPLIYDGLPSVEGKIEKPWMLDRMTLLTNGVVVGKQASWRRMSLTWPPISTVLVVWQSWAGTISLVIRDSGGLTIGALHDEVARAVSSARRYGGMAGVREVRFHLRMVEAVPETARDRG